MTRTRSLVGLGLWAALCLGAGAVGSVFTAGARSDWYVTLAKPPWTPPDWLFGPAWAALYLTMAVAAWLAWRKDGVRWPRAKAFFLAQLLLNALWPALFFGLRMPGAAFGELFALWVAVILTFILFWRVTWRAGLLLVPYLAWTGFAAGLNLAIWMMNIQM